MRYTLALAVVAAIAAVCNSSVFKVTTRATLATGNISAGDKLLYSTYIKRYAIANSTQSQDLIYRGNATTRISSVQALEVGITQYASASIIAGGIGRNNVTIRFQSALGRGYYYQVTIHGR